ncbi:MAG: rod shape-determining protein MreD [Anaerolineaceae bacterium]|nr:MAG: rod shape-determining protein MreD [Anaerolineaceae bacterium]
MASFLSFPILITAAIMQATFLPNMRLFGGAPDLVYLLVLAWAINANLTNSILWAFVGGLAVDLLSVQPLGTSTFGMLLTVFVINGLGDQLYRIGVLTLIALVFVGTVVQQISILGILALTGFAVDWLYGLSYIIAPTIVYNLIAIWPVYWFVRRVQRRIERRGGFSVD